MSPAFRRGDPAEGCPLAATVVDAADNDELRVHVNDLLARWQAAVADVYIKFGTAPAVADEHSTVMLAALEGALILARAQRSTHPLDTVERYFAGRAPDGAPVGAHAAWLTTVARPAAPVVTVVAWTFVLMAAQPNRARMRS